MKVYEFIVYVVIVSAASLGAGFLYGEYNQLREDQTMLAKCQMVEFSDGEKSMVCGGINVDADK